MAPESTKSCLWVLLVKPNLARLVKFLRNKAKSILVKSLAVSIISKTTLLID